MLRHSILALFLLTAASLSATDYYIGPTATGTGDCSSAANRCTFSTIESHIPQPVGAAATCSASSGWSSTGGIGACVHVISGTYPGSITTNKNGTASARIRYVAETQYGPKFTGGSNIIWIAHGRYTDMVGLEFDGTNTPASFTSILTYSNDAPNNVRMLDNKIHHLGGNLNNGGAGALASCGLTTALPDGTVPCANTMERNLLYHNNGGAANIYCCNGNVGLDVGWGDIARNNIVMDQGGGSCIQAAHNADQVTVTNNTILNCSRGGIVVGFTSRTITQSTISNNIVVNSGNPNGLSGIDISSSSGCSTTAIYVNNLMYGNLPTTGYLNGCSNIIPTGTQTGSNSSTFVNYTGTVTGNYHPLSTSTAVKPGGSNACQAGAGLCVPPTDFAGTPQTPTPVIGYLLPASSGGVPIVNLSPSPLAFGSVPVSTPSQLTLTLKNAATSGPALTFSTPTITGSNAADFVITSTTCGTSLAAGASCTYTITFTPHGSGARNGLFTLTDSAQGSPHQVPLTGTGGAVGISIVPPTLAFGLIAPGSCSAVQTSTLTSTGTLPLVLTDNNLIGANAADFQFGGTGNCNFAGGSYDAGQSCTQSAKFCPVTSGSKTAGIAFTDNAPASPQTLNLTGTGGTSTATFTPATFAYGNQQVGTSSAAHTFTYTNTGTLALSITSVSENSTSYSSTDNCPRAPSTLAVATACTVNVVFKPINTGALPAVVTVTGDATQTATLTGTGTQANITITPVTFNFGSVLVGDVSSDQTFIINNTGTASANIGSVTAAAPFSVASTTCGATLASNTTCNAVARFTPTVTGLVAGQLVVADNAPGNPHTAALSGTGTSAGITILPATLAFGNQAVGTVSTPKATIMTNTGSGSLTGPGIVINNLDDVTTLYPPSGWKPVCILPGCNPGGASPPTVTSQTFNNATPSQDGASMKVSLTGPAFSNALWVYRAGADESVLNMTMDFWTQPSANSAVLGSFEFDQAIFHKTLGINFMFGTQCNQASNKWQVWNQLSTSWVNVVGSTCTSLTPGSFHHIVQRVHRVEGDLTGCSGQPCMYFDSITVDGVAVPGLPMTEPAGPLDPTFASSVVWHVQLDIGSTGSSGSPVFENIDKLNWSFNSVNFTGSNPTDFSETNTCPLSIAAGGSCPINVTFTPGAAGPRSATMSVASNAASSPTLVALTGTGTSTAPAVCLDRSSINFGNQPVGSTSGNQPVQITNCGTANLIVLAPTPSANFTASTPCGTLAPLATCNVNIAFAPSVAGTLTGTVNINSNAISSPNVVTVQGFGTQTGATLTPSTVNFGTVVLGQASAATTLTLTNTSNIAIAPLAPVRSGANPSDFNSGACPTSLAVNASCTYAVNFVPTLAGARTSTLTQTFNNISTVLTVALSGTGQATAPAVTLTPTSINFGSVTQGVSTPSQTIQLTNSGTNTLNVTSVTATGTNSGDVTLSADNCSGVAVPPQGVCTVTVAMTPGGLGARSANAHFITSALSSPDDTTLAVIGLAAAAPQATFSANALAFGNIKTNQTSAAQTVTVGNIGDGNLIVSSVTLTGSNPTQYIQSNNCTTVIPNLSCTVTVNFKPTSTGSKPATLTIASNDPTTPSKVIVLTGTGKGRPKAVIGATKISFGATTVGTTSGPAAFTITNTGDDTLNVASITTVGDLFPQTNSCICCPVAPGDSCAVSVQFNPQFLCGQTDTSGTCTSNTHLGTATIVTDADTTTQTVSLEGLAIPVPIPPGPIIISVGGAAQVGGVLRIGYDAAAPVACNGYGNNGYGGSGGCGYGQ